MALLSNVFGNLFSKPPSIPLTPKDLTAKQLLDPRYQGPMTARDAKFKTVFNVLESTAVGVGVVAVAPAVASYAAASFVAAPIATIIGAGVVAPTVALTAIRKPATVVNAASSYASVLDKGSNFLANPSKQTALDFVKTNPKTSAALAGAAVLSGGAAGFSAYSNWRNTRAILDNTKATKDAFRSNSPPVVATLQPQVAAAVMPSTPNAPAAAAPLPAAIAKPKKRKKKKKKKKSTKRKKKSKRKPSKRKAKKKTKKRKYKKKRRR